MPRRSLFTDFDFWLVGDALRKFQVSNVEEVCKMRKYREEEVSSGNVSRKFAR